MRRSKALWVNAKDIPYRGFSLEPERVLKLEGNEASAENVKDFFLELTSNLKANYYAIGFIAYELGYLLEERLIPFYQLPSLTSLGTASCPLAFFYLGKSIVPLELYPEPEDKEKIKIYDERLNVSTEDYKRAIHKIKEYIALGHTYQVNFTCKLLFNFSGSPFELFKALLFSQRCEYACYLEGEDFVVLSLSPELFLEKRGNCLISSPMKGTAKRAPILPLDEKEKTELRESLKTRAENLMILDLLRNDLGKISAFGSVKVDEYLKVKTYPTLHQMVSTVEGQLEKTDLYSIFRSLFPCGSVTGAPKIRTMEIIRELEVEPRGVYTGAVGFIKSSGDFIFNVAIRTVYLQRKAQDYAGELGIGSGIVWDSDPDAEYKETLLKAKFLTKPIPYFFLIETFAIPSDEETLRLHFERLQSSASYFNFPFRLKGFSDFLDFLKKEIGLSSLHQASEKKRVRLILKPEGILFLEVHPFEPWEDPIRVAFKRRKTQTNLFHFHKTSLREEYDKERKWALENGWTEVIFYNDKEEVLEGTISNFFAKKGEIFYTPSLALGILPGVLRRKLIDSKLAQEGEIKLSQLTEFDSLYIGNSSRWLGKIKEWVIL
jgi:para-aminobenzoate synthetase/4-amino-4-deoxychorismate lyase